MYEDGLLYDEIKRLLLVSPFDTYRGSINENSVEKDSWYNSINHWDINNDNSFIYRTELSRIKMIIDSENEYQILITGNAGSGKTTLLYYLCKDLQIDRRKRIINCNVFPRDNNFQNYFFQQVISNNYSYFAA